MKINKPIILIIIAVLILSVMASLYSFYLLENKPTEKVISFATGLIRLSFTIGTFLIAILLYDRFGFRKKLYEKKLEIILDLLIQLKELNFGIRYRNIEKEILLAGNVYPGKEIMKNKIYGKFNKFAYIVFDPENSRLGLKKIMRLKNNPFLPKPISTSLEFLSLNVLTNANLYEQYTNEFVQIEFNNSSKLKAFEIDGWYYANDHTTLKSFIENYELLFVKIEKWLDDHSSIKSELNI